MLLDSSYGMKFDAPGRWRPPSPVSAIV